MSIRLPLKRVLDVNDSTEVGSGPASTAGGVAHSFLLPQDTDNVIVKLTASVKGGGVSALFQTSDDASAFAAISRGWQRTARQAGAIRV